MHGIPKLKSLMIVPGAEGESDFLAEDVVVIVENAYAPLTAVAM